MSLEQIRKRYAAIFDPPKDFPWEIAHARANKYLGELRQMANGASPEVGRAINSAASYLNRADAL